MRQSLKATHFHHHLLLPTGDRIEARALSRAARTEEYEWLHLEFKPGRELVPRPES
ncbi:hypothetical protein ACE3MQ_16155 [Paenibacillus lentus]|uniref:hypothetical protein n=1 Tax=Paenibacillus lentus TaxID=1338368 RepID=UPI00366A2853